MPRPEEDQVIYTVECSFADPGSEAEWNDFYSQGKLPALISVGGFHTSQRFKALSSGCPVYLALHSIDGLDVLTGEEYRQKGGGNFARWQQHITDWHRNLYDGLDRAPDVGPDELLLISSVGAQALAELGLAPSHLLATALEKSPAQRWLAKVARTQLPPAKRLPRGIDVYEAMTAQLNRAAARPAR
ncbi:sugar ABC transporter [Pleomorphomonas oryzae]|uniref:sugar ABC transporter n=1 Tax=Pleomorphomonas oryzae TaxID=261934 RepID=UPI001FDEB457|nr:sugar ABC transporter [Pleomorphomonas oryzae]